MRLNEATEKRELAHLKLQQLHKLQELELKKLRVKGEEDTLKLQNEYKQAILSERIWGQAEEVISREEKQELPKFVSRKDESPKSGQPLPFIKLSISQIFKLIETVFLVNPRRSVHPEATPTWVAKKFSKASSVY